MADNCKDNGLPVFFWGFPAQSRWSSPVCELANRQGTSSLLSESTMAAAESQGPQPVPRCLNDIIPSLHDTLKRRTQQAAHPDQVLKKMAGGDGKRGHPQSQYRRKCTAGPHATQKYRCATLAWWPLANRDAYFKTAKNKG